MAQNRRNYRRFLADESGVYAVLAALLMPVFVGAVGLATDYGMWVYQHQSTQSATDSAAVSAATGGGLNSDVVKQARGVAALYGFVDGIAGVNVVVNQPPTSGPQSGNAKAVEVIISKPAVQTFSSLFLTGPVNVKARSVASSKPGFGCIIALNATASYAIDLRGSGSIQAPNCDVYSNSMSATAVATCCGTSLTANMVKAVGGVSGGGINAANGIKTGVTAAPDPYLSVSIPTITGCDYNFKQYTNNANMSPGVYCNGITLQGNASVTMSPGVYYIDRGSFTMTSNTSLTGTGVTIVLTSSTGANWPTLNFTAGSSLDLTAPNSGNFEGIAFYQDRNTPVGTAIAMTGGSNQSINGSVYVPRAALSFAGGSSTTVGCNQVVADTIKFTGNGNLSVDCAALGTKSVGSVTALLVE